MNKNPLKHIVL